MKDWMHCSRTGSYLPASCFQTWGKGSDGNFLAHFLAQGGEMDFGGGVGI